MEIGVGRKTTAHQRGGGSLGVAHEMGDMVEEDFFATGKLAVASLLVGAAGKLLLGSGDPGGIDDFVPQRAISDSRKS